MKAKVYNQNLEAVSEMDLNPKIFEVRPVIELITEAVRAQRSNSRKAISNTKTRGEVRGGGKKPWKQKGTGNARAGSIRSPLWRHGGVTFGPRSNRNYAIKINQKQLRKALFMALSDKAAEQNIVLIDQLAFTAPQTKEAAKIVGAIQHKVAKDAKKFLFILPRKEQNSFKSIRNLKNAQTIIASSLNVLDLVNADALVMATESVPVIEKTYLKAV